jgi:outer membrane PBP1 activator LpoA protein
MDEEEGMMASGGVFTTASSRVLVLEAEVARLHNEARHYEMIAKDNESKRQWRIKAQQAEADRNIAEERTHRLQLQLHDLGQQLAEAVRNAKAELLAEITLMLHEEFKAQRMQGSPLMVNVLRRLSLLGRPR